MVRPNYSVLDIADSVRPNLGSAKNVEIRFGRIRRFGAPLLHVLGKHLNKCENYLRDREKNISKLDSKYPLYIFEFDNCRNAVE